MLLLILLENGLLDRKRGDVVIFNNTGAEHPATYEFVARCKQVTEHKFRIPFFITEYQTYENSDRGVWARLPAYRLTNAQPYSSDNPDGYRCNGEPFEEMLSWAGYVPNQFRRICTHSLKLETTRLFLLDWFFSRDRIPHLGHWKEYSEIDIDELYRRHVRAGGSVPRDIYLRKKEYVLNKCSLSRSEQRYGDFTEAPVSGRGPKSRDPGTQEYISFIGLRGDEQARVRRTKSRAEIDGNDGRAVRERIYMPLADMRISKSDVLNFWKAQKHWDLALPDSGHMSNCVYCFLKGRRTLGKVHAFMNKDGAEPSDATEPSKISWWVNLEKKYGRDLKAERRVSTDNGKSSNYVGFFGTNSKYDYSTVVEKHSDDSLDDMGLFDDAGMLPCNCTD